MATKATTYTRNEPSSATQKRIVDALIALGDGWHTTRDIANAIGRKQLWNADRGTLARLVADGKLEARQTPTPGKGLLLRYEYRVIGKLIGPTE